MSTYGFILACPTVHIRVYAGVRSGANSLGWQWVAGTGVDAAPYAGSSTR